MDAGRKMDQNQPLLSEATRRTPVRLHPNQETKFILLLTIAFPARRRVVLPVETYLVKGFTVMRW